MILSYVSKVAVCVEIKAEKLEFEAGIATFPLRLD
jgi:hypothetical protein